MCLMVFVCVLIVLIQTVLLRFFPLLWLAALIISPLQMLRLKVLVVENVRYVKKMNDLDKYLEELFSSRAFCQGCQCSSCASPDCTRRLCDSLPDTDCFHAGCPVYETQGNYYYDDNGDEYWIGEDNRRHYTRDEG